MKPVLTVVSVVMMLGWPPVAHAQEQSGRFPVFGPSSEREAFFQTQRDNEAARVERLEEQRREAELARDLARQEAEAAKAAARAAALAAQPRSRRLVRRCFLTEPRNDVAAVTDEEAPFKLKVMESNLPSRIRCPRYVFVPGDPYDSSIAINVEDGDVSGRVRIRRPGLNIDLRAE